MHNKAWFGCFFAPSRLQNRSPQARKTAKRCRKCTVGLPFSQSAQNSQKSHQPSPFPTMVSILQPAISRRQVILPRPYTPTYKSDYHILTTNNHSCSTSQNHKSQITINKKSIVEKVKKEEVSLYIYLYLILYILYIIYIILILPALTQASQKQQLIFC